MMPTPTRPFAANKPLATDTKIKQRLFTTFMSGIKKPDQIKERVPARQRASFFSSNASITWASRP